MNDLAQKSAGGFETALKLSSYLLLIAGFASLLISDAFGPFLGLAYVVAVLASWPFEIRYPRGVQILAISLLLLVFGLNLIALSGFIEATIHLLMTLSLLKLFGEKGNRDYQLIYAISFTYLIIAATYTISVLFFVSLVVYVFLANLSFVLFESRTAFRENRRAYFSLTGYLKIATLITLLVVLVAAPIFVAFPRSALGFFQLDDKLAGSHLSGFSDHVSLGDLGSIINDHRVFMRVRLESESRVSSDTKWRGISLDYYDGRSWRNTEKNYRYIQKNSSTRSFEITPTRIGVEAHLRQYFSLAGFSNVIFGAGRIIQVFGLPGDTIRQDEHGSLTALWTRLGDSLTYVVDSGVIPRGWKLNQAAEGEIPEDIRQRYLQLPQLDPRITELAQVQTQGRQLALAKALVLENFLKTSYGYSLENPSGGTPDPLVDFLFESREGHCEYFATSLAVMLRTLGIPSRVVNGFNLGEYNEWNDSFIVRHSDAHSWTEGYFPGAGWIEFDPTPTSSISSFSALNFARHFLDAIDVFWTEVITFDRFKQIGFFASMAGNIRSGLHSLQDARDQTVEALAGWWRGLWPPDVSALLKLGLVLLAGLSARWLYRVRGRLAVLWKERVLRQSSTQLVPSLYQELLRVLSRKGYERKPSETPLEFSQRMNEEMVGPVLARITDLYYQSRFGSYVLADEEIAEIRAGITGLSSRFKVQVSKH